MTDFVVPAPEQTSVAAVIVVTLLVFAGFATMFVSVTLTNDTLATVTLTGGAVSTFAGLLAALIVGTLPATTDLNEVRRWAAAVDVNVGDDRTVSDIVSDIDGKKAFTLTRLDGKEVKGMWVGDTFEVHGLDTNHRLIRASR